MPLNETRLKNKIIEIIETCQSENDNPNTSKVNFATLLAKAIIEELQLADVIGICPTNGGPLTEGKIQ
ncbi:hypothetical protein [Weeksella virosa]|uniref:Cysteine desulfurase NifS n=1 Tax=Weeksella virosa (strain ATCC 43766 / DSM 16922 / JCM 21250 / CCUG 30538 / CDC 9751 / IAM 14551 / NBRC 16016 / NCTC 11634 / CL345/78) TaxID=865938 RepID=F0P2U1_WEEVC|nr:hypothetical protein [Weeksella virosa]ADX66831.1 cysteine desulfurase NifS [Weeksella virosa DSM 16922]VEH63445.1 Uncharacterised protein [Weeksella virosa]